MHWFKFPLGTFIRSLMLRKLAKAWSTLVVRVGDFHCLWSLVCKMLYLSEKNTMGYQRITTSVNQA
jgi:hypothetical protein